MHNEEERREWLHVLSHAAPADLEESWRQLAAPHAFDTLRHAQSGLAMIRGRADGSGRPFNMGEATISRCVVTTTDTRTGGEIMGVGYVLGRDKRHAELTAHFDAVFQDTDTGAAARERVLPPLRAKRADALERTARKTDGTRVDFFTMVRGE